MAGKPYEPMIGLTKTASMMGISRESVLALVKTRQLHATSFVEDDGKVTYRFRQSDVERAMSQPQRKLEERQGLEPKSPKPKKQASRRGRQWLRFDVEYAAALHDAGISFEEMAWDFGVSPKIVARAVLARRGEASHQFGKRRAIFDLDRAIELRRAGKTFAEIAAEIGGAPASIIRNAVREAAPETRNPLGFRDLAAVKRMLAMRRGGATYEEIGVAFGLGLPQVIHGFKVLGIGTPRINRGVRKEFDVARAVEMRRSGETYRAIAREFGLSVTTVTRAIRENSGLKGSKFAFDIDRAMKMRREGHSYGEIAKAVGASRPTVMNAIKIKMLSSPMGLIKPRFDLAQARTMRRADMTYRAIAKALGVSPGSVARHLKREGDAVNSKYGPRFDLQQARQMQGNGASLPEIAEACGVSVSTISRYLTARPKAAKSSTGRAAEEDAPGPSAAEPGP